jgi:DNA-binding transcriptional ArsR family regulator
MRTLPAELKRDVSAFSFAFRRQLPDLLAPSPEHELRSFEDELAALRRLEAETVALEFTRPLYDTEGSRDLALLERDEVRRHILGAARFLGGDPELARLVFEDPAELRDRFAGLVERYWEAAFAEEWERLEPRLADAVSEAGRRVASDGLYSFLRGVSLQLRVDPEREEFGIDVPHSHTVVVTEERRLLLVPSAYVWPHVHVNCDEPWPLSVVYAPPFVAEDSRPPVPSGELVGVLRALGDQTRLRALKLIAERPRSTQELAPLVGISEAGLSKHLRQLAGAGLLETRREGYYVLYSLRPERIDALSDGVRRFMDE